MSNKDVDEKGKKQQSYTDREQRYK